MQEFSFIDFNIKVWQDVFIGIRQGLEKGLQGLKQEKIIDAYSIEDRMESKVLHILAFNAVFTDSTNRRRDLVFTWKLQPDVILMSDNSETSDRLQAAWMQCRDDILKTKFLKGPSNHDELKTTIQTPDRSGRKRNRRFKAFGRIRG